MIVDFQKNSFDRYPVIERRSHAPEVFFWYPLSSVKSRFVTASSRSAELPKHCCIARALREPVVDELQERNFATDLVVCALNAVYCFWYAAHCTALSRDGAAADATPAPSAATTTTTPIHRAQPHRPGPYAKEPPGAGSRARPQKRDR